MDTSVQTPACFTLFDPAAPECAGCGIQTDCMKAQEQHVLGLEPKAKEKEQIPEEPPKPEPKRKEKPTKKQPTYTSDGQYIPEHTRKPLEIPPVGSKIQTTYRGQTYQAVIVDDPSNKRSDGRSILFNGTVYRTLTAAAHAISPGINSGSVWQHL